MDTETRKRIEDFFEGFELVEFLRLDVSDVIDAFEEQVDEALEEIEELIGLRREYDDQEE
jgi:hypothetical protein